MHFLKCVRMSKNLPNIFWFTSRIHKDKINALRKKYDDFLEEDKQRKTRNDFILGRLEKMRSCVEAVQSYHNTVDPFADNNRKATKWPVHLRSFRSPGDINIQQNIVPSNSKWMEESIILKEISQKYILIPKTNTIFQKSSPNDENIVMDSDWKSKYNILDRLKNEENDELPERDISASQLIDGKELDKKQNIKLYEPPQKNESDNCDSNNIVCIANSRYDDNITQCTTEKNQETVIPTADYYSTSNENIIEENNGIQCKEVIEPNEQIGFNDTSDRPVKGKSCIQYIEEQNAQENVNNINTSDILYGETMNSSIKDNKIKLQQKGNIIPSKELHLKQNNNVFDKSPEILMTKDGNEEDNKTLPGEDHVKDSVQPNFSQPVLNSTQEYESVEDTMSSDLHNTQINEFETEQKEMFYSEQSDKVIENSEVTVDASGYPVENNYSAYNYYEGTQENQAYPPEINEHEETTENYDPNYEQQYINNYGNVEYLNQYENQPFENSYTNQQDENINYQYSQQPQDNVQSDPLPPDNNNIPEQQHTENLYEHTVRDENQIENAVYEQHYQSDQQNIAEDEQSQNIEYQTNEYDTQENIERELDAEDGYVEKQKTIVVTDTLEENVLKISSEHDTIPDVH